MSLIYARSTNKKIYKVVRVIEKYDNSEFVVLVQSKISKHNRGLTYYFKNKEDAIEECFLLYSRQKNKELEVS